MKSKVSIIVPVYNTSKFLPRCLDSILNQTYRNLEIITVNDGSTDNSLEILEKYAKKDSRIKIISQKNQGLSAARNAGLKKSTGDYITFIDSDDTVDHEMIENLAKNDSDIAVCSFQEVYPDGKIKFFNQHSSRKVYDTKQALKDMLLEKNFNLTATMKLYRKSTLKGVEFPEGKLHEDVGFTYKAIINAKKITFVPKPYYIYHHHSNSIISKFNPQKFDLLELTDKMCNDIDNLYPDLKNITNERRMRARFSLLRQIPLSHPRKNELLTFLKQHQSYITKNPDASKKDKTALKLAIFSPKLFQLAYKLFK